MYTNEKLYCYGLNTSFNYTFSVMPDNASAEKFLNTLNDCHSSVNFTMEVENDGSLPFVRVGAELPNVISTLY